MTTRHCSPDDAVLSYPERRWRAALTLGWPLALGAAPLLLSLGDIPLCAFRQLTGRPCPLCGGTHVCAALVEGNLALAWQANPGLLALLAISAAHSIQLAYEAWTARTTTRWRVGQGIWYAGVAFLIATWLLRL